MFVRAFLDSTRAQETDTHFRCQDGKGSFNYRLVFDVCTPGDSLQLSVQVWDRDIFKSNDFIGDAGISLKLPIADAIETQKTISVNKKYYDAFLGEQMGEDAVLDFKDENSFWIPCRDKDGNENGRVRVQIDIIPKDM